MLYKPPTLHPNTPNARTSNAIFYLCSSVVCVVTVIPVTPPPPMCFRRFRSLKLWFVLRMYGADKLQGLVRHHIALGEWVAEQVKADSR